MKRRKLRIAQLADLWHPATHHSVGGRGFITGVLSDELVKRGHEVTLFASGESTHTPHLVSIVDVALKGRDIDTTVLNIAQAYDRADQFDLIHNHVGHYALPFAQFVATPTLTTLHYPAKSPFVDEYIERYKNFSYFNSLSYAMQKLYEDIEHCANIYNGIIIEDFLFQEQPEDFLLFLGRLSPDKGVHIAIEVAKMSGDKLIIGGMVPRPDEDYFNEEIKPHIDNKQIVHIGEVCYEDKVKLYGRAKAFLHPIAFYEPFGLTVIEAMACGTPVLAFDRGAMREVVQDGKTGFLAVTQDSDGLVEALQNIDKIDRQACRKHVEEHFTIGKMTDGYESLYQKIMQDRHKE